MIFDRESNCMVESFLLFQNSTTFDFYRSAYNAFIIQEFL